MTATPKETKYASNIEYFGPPVYTYSLKQGIQDGFLAPYKVINVHVDVDVDGYRPEKGKTDREGEEVPDRIYNQKDFDRTLVIDDRTKLVAKRVTEFLKESGDRFQKTILFCVDQEHAARMRQALVNENRDLAADNSRYVMRITANDRDGQDQLGNFIDPESSLPGPRHDVAAPVDRSRCADVPAHRPRPARRVHDGVQADPRARNPRPRRRAQVLLHADGLPRSDAALRRPRLRRRAGADLRARRRRPDRAARDRRAFPARTRSSSMPGNDISHRHRTSRRSRKIYVNGVLVTIIAERVKYLDADGKLVTESLRDYSKRAVTSKYASLDTFLRRWKSEDRKQAIIEELEEAGLRLDILAEEVNPDLDPFDLICHVAYGRPPLTRRERADNVRKRDVFSQVRPAGAGRPRRAARRSTRTTGSSCLDDVRILQIPPIDRIGTTVELVRQFGGKDEFEDAVHELQERSMRLLREESEW